jgi:hypothetical protein
MTCTPENGVLVIKILDSGQQRSEFAQTGIDLKPGVTYTLFFRAKSDVPQQMRALVSRDMPFQKPDGLNAQADLTTDWQDFCYTFAPANPFPRHMAAPAFYFAGTPSSISVYDVWLLVGKHSAGEFQGTNGNPNASVSGLRNLLTPVTDLRAWTARPQTWRNQGIEKLGPIVHLAVTNGFGAPWKQYYAESGIPLLEGQAYTIEFRAKSNKVRNLLVATSRDGAGSAPLGLYKTVVISQTWQTFRFVFVATDSNPSRSLAPAFVYGDQDGDVYLRDIGLYQGYQLPLPNLPNPDSTAMAAPASLGITTDPNLDPQQNENLFTGSIASLSAATGRLEMKVVSVTSPSGNTTTLVTPRLKLVRITDDTLIRTPDGAGQETSDDLTTGIKISVIGVDHGPGTPLIARIIAPSLSPR